MIRTTFALAAAAAAAWAGPARADTLPLVVGAPATYTPGTPFTFEVRAPNLVDFTSYNVEFVFTTDVAGQLTATAAADPVRYPFPTAPTFPPGGGSGTEFRLALADSSAVGVVTVPGVNDLLAVVTVNPSAALTGPIIISVDPASLRFAVNEEVTPTVEPPPPITVQQGEAPPAPVPGPAAWVGLAIGGLALAARRRFSRA